MCGIAGFIDRTCPSEETPLRLRRMLDLIIHRGPDGQGVFVDPPRGVALGMRRLSIIDLEGGSQPIWNEDSTIGVVFNGEIYNYLELRAELIAQGHAFKTQSDTEVLVHLYEEAGASMLSRLRGMFGFAIIDLRQRLLFVARDHFGQKPIYYAQQEGRLAFGSELKSLFALPWISREPDPGAFLDYAAWMSLPPPRTHFRHIAKLPAGHHLIVPLDRPDHGKPTRYWSYSLAKPPTLRSMEDAAAELDETFSNSIKLHLRADVPLGVLLSGGLDSRTVTAYAQELLQGGMQTFTVGFCDADSELKEAAETAAEIHSKHHALELTAEDFAGSIERIAWHLDEPIGDPAAFAVLKVCEMARQHVKVLLSGEGADELFGGYDGRYLGMLDTLHRSDRVRPLASILPAGDPAGGASRWQRLLVRAHHSRASEMIALRLEGFPGDIRSPRGFSPDQIRRLRGRMTELGDTLVRPQRDALSQLLVLDLEWQLAESLLQKADKMSMGASIELRTPLLDTGVAALAARIDSSLKLPPGGPGKLVMRHCLARKLKEPLTRPKRGFPIPLNQWFRGPLRSQVEASIFDPNGACAGHLDLRLLRTAWDDFLANRWDGARAFYALWLYQVWAARLAATPTPA
jgi:asparagine synthase (glutamine-hydrolysing)